MITGKLLFLSIALTTVSVVSATPISDVSSIPNSAFGAYGLIMQGPASGNNSLQLTSDSSDSHINTNIAVDANGKIGGAGVVVNGNVDTAAATNTGITNTTVTSGHAIETNIPQASQTVADASSLLQHVHIYHPGRDGDCDPKCGGRNLNVANTSTATVNGNEFVYSLANNAFGSTTSLTITASQYVIINVTGNGDFKLANLALNGITSDHVLLNVEATGNLQATNGDVVNADITDDGGTVNWDADTLNGRLFCTAAKGNCSVVSNAMINASVSTATPEPMSFVLIGSGLLAVFGMRKFRNAIPLS